MATEDSIVQENRKVQRLRTLKAAKIVLNHGGVIDCVVRDMTPSGACLEVTSPIGIPDEFLLANGGKTKWPCRAVWRSQKRIGVAFKMFLLTCFSSSLTVAYEWTLLVP
jgi:hypothetical protein